MMQRPHNKCQQSGDHNTTDAPSDAGATFAKLTDLEVRLYLSSQWLNLPLSNRISPVKPSSCSLMIFLSPPQPLGTLSTSPLSSLVTSACSGTCARCVIKNANHTKKNTQKPVWRWALVSLHLETRVQDSVQESPHLQYHGLDGLLAPPTAGVSVSGVSKLVVSSCA